MEYIFHYGSNKDNNDYLMVNVKSDILRLIQRKNPPYIQEIIEDAYFGLIEYEKEHKEIYLSDKVAIKKDSFLGYYITSNSHLFCNDDNYISYQKIVNAFNIAVYNDDVKMSNKIMPLFKSKVSGSKKELSQIPEVVLNYILDNDDFNHYLNNDNTYLVYEDETYQVKSLKVDNQNLKRVGKIHVK